MDKENQALNEIGEEENIETISPGVEAEATEETEEVEPEPAGDEETEPEETEESPKKGYSKRVRELNARAKKAEAEAESLASKLRELTDSSAEPVYQSAPEADEPLVAPGEEIDATELDRRLRAREAKVLEKVEGLVTLRGKQQEAVSRINREAEVVMKKYPELDPDNEGFNKGLSEAISEATEAYVLKNPYSASVTKFVDKMMRPYKGAVSKEVGEMTGSMAKQVSEAALRPTSVREKERSAREKSIAELEAELGIVQA